MNKSNRLILLLALLMNYAAKGQYNQVNFYPPQAASLMSKVDYPVSHMTGMPDIRIPLHTVTTSSFTMPVELSFHLDNFIKANTMPGSAGAGWSLSTELQISRSINGGDDLKPTSGYCFSTTVPSNYTNGFQSRTRSQMMQMVSGYADEEPDKFFYQLLNKSGSFYFQKQANGTFVPVPVPFNGVKIDYNFTTKQFTIIDTDGTTYTFSTSIVDWSSNLNSTNSQLLSWKCESIKNAAGVQEISFTYANSYEKTECSFNDRQEIYDDVIDNVGMDAAYSLYCNSNYDNPPPVPFWQITGAKQVNYGGTASSVSALNHDFQFQDIGYYPVDGAASLTYRTVKNHLVTEIGFRDGSIAFNYVNQEQLSSIVVKNSAGVAIKTVNFMQSYNGSPGSSELTINTYRHSRKLDSIRINDQSWSFTYGFNRQYGTVSDYWGYEAFIPSGSSATVPTQTVEVFMGNCRYFYDCWSNIPAQSGNVTIGQGRTIDQILELHEGQLNAFTIKYPTGGRTEFMVGHNRFRDPDDGIIKGAGGYRVEKILHYDAVHTTPASEKIYKYGIDEDGAGIVKTKPSFDPYTGNCFLTERIRYGGIATTFVPHFDVRKRTFLSGATRSLTFSNGAVVNYNTVTEYNADMGVVTGKKEYKYDLNSYSPPYTSPTDPFPFERNDWDIGRLSSVIDYKYSNGAFDWVKKQIMNYNTFLFPYKIFQGRSSLRGDAIVIETSGGTPPPPGAVTEQYGNLEYKYDAIETGVNQLTSEQEITKDNNGNTLTNQTNYFYTNPDPSVVTRKEKTESTGQTTTEHITYPADYAAGGFITPLIQNNIVSVPIEKVIRRNGQIVSGNLSTYNSSGTLATSYAIESSPALAQSSFRMSNKSAAGDFTSATPNVAYNRDPNYVEKLNLSWDNNLNLLQVSPVNNVAKSYIWNYNKVYPVAEAINAPAGLIAYTSFETDDHGGWALTGGGTIANNNIITGKKIYSGGLNKTVPQGNYTVTAWARGNITVNGSAGNQLTVSKRDGNWRLVSWELTDVTFIQLLADFVDEVRLHPSGAMMTTYTYDPVVGMTTKCDAANGITYYEYDSSGRLSVIRDQDFKIIKSFDYKYKTQ